MQVVIRSNVRQFRRRQDRRRRQVPFATARALNDVAFEGRGELVRKTFPNAFDLKNRRFAAVLFRVAKASKRRLVATIFDRLGRSYLVMHATGGVKQAQGSARIAIPTENVGRTAGGRVRKRLSPRALRDQETTVVIAEPGGRGGIYRRTRQGLRMMYALTPRAVIDKRLMFAEDLSRLVSRRFPRHFTRRFLQAMRTAR